MKLLTERGFKYTGNLIIIIALVMIGKALYLPTKAVAAQLLLEYAWQQTQDSGKQIKPWPWADTTAMARISFPDHGKSYLVLSGSSGRTLAFGPGHLPGSSQPGESGHMVISAHRDSHFNVLENVMVGDKVEIETISGDRYVYLINTTRVVDSNSEALLLDHSYDQLTLITCYPFTTMESGGPLRLRLDASLSEKYAYRVGSRSF